MGDTASAMPEAETEGDAECADGKNDPQKVISDSTETTFKTLQPPSLPSNLPPAGVEKTRVSRATNRTRSTNEA